jgi:hypothetical protein
MPNRAIRIQCYNEVMTCLDSWIQEFYKRHEEVLDPEHVEQTRKDSSKALECLFDILDKYEISKKP